MKRTLCLLLFLSLTLTGCAAAAPRFDLAAGEIAAAEGLTLHMPRLWQWACRNFLKDRQ